MMVNLPCLMGSLSQLPSSHLLIHRVLAKLSNRVMPHGVYYCQLQLLFLFWSYWPLVSTGYGYSVDALPRFSRLVLLMMQCFSHSIVIGFLFQNPARSQNVLLWNPARVWNCILFWLRLLMLPALAALPGVLCPLTSSSDHILSLSSKSYR